MENTTSLLLPRPQPAETPVLVDVYTWLQFCERHSRLFISGVFRHAEALCRTYWPAYTLSQGEFDFSPETVERLSNYLGKEIVVTRDPALLAARGLRVWLTLGIDFTPPWLSQPMPFKKVTIAHDTFSLDGQISEANLKGATIGALHCDAFAYVSITSLGKFTRHLQKLHRNSNYELIPYGCFHSLTELPDSVAQVRRESMAISVGTVSPRKNVAGARFVSGINKYIKHFHVGVVEEMSSDEIYELSFRKGLIFLGGQNDDVLLDLYQKTEAFVCASYDEGFSMPPMEAIIHGVPYVMLSDIPAHREIYADSGVFFFDPLHPHKAVCDGSGFVPEQKSREIYERYTYKAVAAKLHQYISGI